MHRINAHLEGNASQTLKEPRTPRIMEDRAESRHRNFKGLQSTANRTRAICLDTTTNSVIDNGWRLRQRTASQLFQQAGVAPQISIGDIAKPERPLRLEAE